MKEVKRYILKGTTPCIEPDFSVWEQWYLQADREICYTEIPITEKNRFLFGINDLNCRIKIKTQFLALDHSLFGQRPLLFETRIIGGQYDQRCQWTSTWQEAMQEHEFNVNALQQGGFVCKLNPKAGL
jgi:hypothetical protein